MNQTIFLVGPRASGKTTIGQHLAQILHFTFIDTDTYIVDKAKQTINDIVAELGWDSFRKMESQALQSVTKPNCVIATGGGMILSEHNRQFMHSNGVVFLLSTTAEILAERLLKDPNNHQRPSLTGLSIHAEIATVLKERYPLYLDAADYVIDVNQSEAEVVQQMVAKLKSHK